MKKLHSLKNSFLSNNIILITIILSIFMTSFVFVSCSNKEAFTETVSASSSDEPVLSDNIREIFKNLSVEDYSVKFSYGDGIQNMYLIYDENKEIIAGVAERNTRTYRESNMIVTVVKTEDGYKISDAVITDVNSFPGKSKDYTLNAVGEIKGTTIKDANKAMNIVDAVSSATDYYKAIYISSGLMASKIISEFNNKPDWEVFNFNSK